MRLRNKFKFDNISPLSITSSFEALTLVGTDGSGLRGGLQAGRDAYDTFSATGGFGGASEARGNGALLANSVVLGNLGFFSNPDIDAPHGTFTLKRAAFAASFHESVTFRVDAFLDGQVASTQTLSVGTARTKVDLGIAGVDFVVITKISTGPQQPFDITVPQTTVFPPIMIDNIITSTVAPDPLI